MPLNSKLRSLWEETPLKESIYISAATSITLAVGILVLRGNLPPKLPLFYGKPVGEAELTTITGFLIAPAAALSITCFNTLLSFVFKDVFVKKILILSSLFATLLIAITLVKIITLVGFF